MENESSTAIYGNTADAPYINSLLTIGAYATNFVDVLPSVPSEPHYIWMVAGTNVFADHTFTTDANASATNSTASTEHLGTQLTSAGIPWVTYQEGMKVGICPIHGFGAQAASHDPFVFFQDLVGNPPSATAPACIEHHKPFSDFATDLANEVVGYALIVPDKCHDMHGMTSCPSGTDPVANIRAGDAWLAAELPRIIDYTATHDALLFVVWDEGRGAIPTMPFIAIGPHVVPGPTDTRYDHSSLLKTTEKFLGVPALATVEPAVDLGGLFEAGQVP